MISRGDKVSVLDEAVDGVVISVEKDQVTIETSDGFMMTYFVNELIKINKSSNLEQSIRSFDLNKIKKEKEESKPRSFEKKRKLRAKFHRQNLIYTSKNWLKILKE